MLNDINILNMLFSTKIIFTVIAFIYYFNFSFEFIINYNNYNFK